MSDVMVPYISNRPLRGTRALAGGRLGALGTSPIIGTVASKGASLGVGLATTSLVGTAAGTAGGALFGAAAGSVVPVIGTIIGAVVGILTSKLFGHANYAAVYANIANVAQLFQAYSQVAGQYVGRQYGWPELQYIWHGAMVSGLFPGNGPPAGQACTQAMISNRINACGTGQWIDDLLGSSKPTSPGTDNIAELIAGGLSRGIVDPVTMTNQVLVPGMETIAARKNNGWISVARSANPALYKQLLMDTADYMMSTVNPNMPAYYGSQNIQPVPQTSSAQPSQPAAQSQAAQIASMTQATINNAASRNVAAQPVIQVAPPTAAPPTSIVTPTGSVVTPVASIPVPVTPPALVAAGGTSIPVNETAAYIAQLQAQGASQNQAMLAAIAQLQSQGLSAQAAQSTVSAAVPGDTSAVTPLAQPVTTGGVSGTQSALILGGLVVLAVIFATARPHNSNLGKKS